MVNNERITRRERQALTVLKEANGGLDSYQIAGQMDISVHMTEVYLHLLWTRGLVAQRGNRYYIEDRGTDTLKQPLLPGMEAIDE